MVTDSPDESNTADTLPSPSASEASSSLVSAPPGGQAKANVSRRPSKPPPGQVDYYREWVKGNSVQNLVKTKLSATAEARRLKALKNSEDERRAVMMFRRMDASEQAAYLDDLGADDPVLRKLCLQKRQRMSCDVADGMDVL